MRAEEKKPEKRMIILWREGVTAREMTGKSWEGLNRWKNEMSTIGLSTWADGTGGRKKGWRRWKVESIGKFRVDSVRFVIEEISKGLG